MIGASDVGLIDFNEVLETGPEFLRYSVDGTQTFVKWEGDPVPNSVLALPVAPQILDQAEILALLAGPEWSAGTSGQG